MAQGSKLRDIIKGIVKETIEEMQNETNNADPESGVISAVNDDGTVTVSTQSGFYQSVGTPTVRTLGEQVVVITADGQKVAI